VAEDNSFKWVCAPLWRVGGFPLPPPPNHGGVQPRDYRHALYRTKQLTVRQPQSQYSSGELDDASHTHQNLIQTISSKELQSSTDSLAALPSFTFDKTPPSTKKLHRRSYSWPPDVKDAPGPLNSNSELECQSSSSFCQFSNFPSLCKARSLTDHMSTALKCRSCILRNNRRETSNCSNSSSNNPVNDNCTCSSPEEFVHVKQPSRSSDSFLEFVSTADSLSNTYQDVVNDPEDYSGGSSFVNLKRQEESDSNQVQSGGRYQSPANDLSQPERTGHEPQDAESCGLVGQTERPLLQSSRDTLGTSSSCEDNGGPGQEKIKIDNLGDCFTKIDESGFLEDSTITFDESFSEIYESNGTAGDDCEDDVTLSGSVYDSGTSVTGALDFSDNRTPRNESYQVSNALGVTTEELWLADEDVDISGAYNIKIRYLFKMYLDFHVLYR